MGNDGTGRPGPALLGEAGCAMLLGSVLIRILPFRRLASLLSRNSTQPVRTSDEEIRRIRRAIQAWSRRLPWRTKCFEEGVAAHWMLRRRGLASTLYYGAATIDGQLKAHVWVRSGDKDVVGCENADEYAELARFPNERFVSIGSHNQ